MSLITSVQTSQIKKVYILPILTFKNEEIFVSIDLNATSNDYSKINSSLVLLIGYPQ